MIYCCGVSESQIVKSALIILRTDKRIPHSVETPWMESLQYRKIAQFSRNPPNLWSPTIL